MNEIKDFLISINEKFEDDGEYIRCRAFFRNGKNPKSIAIFKNSGVWIDYGGENSYRRFEELSKMAGKGSLAISKNYDKEQEKMTEERIYPVEILKKLLPHYDFYTKKGISDMTLKSLKSGVAVSGKMYQRFVFPIFNQHGNIHGFSGRDIVNGENRPKWKHLGRSKNFVYPCFSDNGECQSAIDESRYVIIVESIGDMIKLRENHIYNVVCSFGLNLSPTLIAFLIASDPDFIVLSFNNDKEKESRGEKNSGKHAAIKEYVRLLEFFDRQQLCICLPDSGDFGDMKSSLEFDKWLLKLETIRSKEEEYAKKIVSEASKTLAGSKLKNIKGIV